MNHRSEPNIERKTYRSGPYEEYFAQGTQVGDVIYLSGQIGTDEHGHTPASIAEQTKVAYANTRAVLAEFGAVMTDVVDETWFVTDMAGLLENVEEVYAVREAAYGSRPELCQTLVQVGGLVDPALKIEIKCIAHLVGGRHANV